LIRRGLFVAAACAPARALAGDIHWDSLTLGQLRLMMYYSTGLGLVVITVLLFGIRQRMREAEAEGKPHVSWLTVGVTFIASAVFWTLIFWRKYR